MATLAQINETLRDQTSSIEDGTRTTAGLRDRFGEFLDRQQGSGDKREQEIEERQKERRQRVMAQRPRGFSAGLQQGLGFGGGFGFGAIAERILGAMGLAAGAIGLGAGKLISFAPAIAVMSKFGEMAINSLVDYVEKEYFDDKQLEPKTKEDLVDGVQTAIGARLLGVKSPLGLAIAGIVGAYGDTAIAAINEKFGNKDGVYNIPGTELDIDTQSDAFISGLGVALSFVAPALLRFAGKRLALALALLPIGKGVKALSTALALAMGIKTFSGGAPPDPDEIKKNKKPTLKTIKPVAGSAAASRLLKFNNPLGQSRLIPGTTKLKPAFAGANVARAPDGRFMSFNNPLGESKLPKSGLSAFLQSLKQFDGALKLTTKVLVPLGVAAEVAMAQNNPNFEGMDPVSKSAAGLLTSPLSLLDSIQNLYATANNLTNQAVNFGLEKAGIDYQFGMMGKLDTAGPVQRAINTAYGNFLSQPSMIGMAPPNIGLAPTELFNAFPNGQVQFNDLSNNQQNRGGDINVISIGNTQDFGSKVVDIGKF